MPQDPDFVPNDPDIIPDITPAFADESEKLLDVLCRLESNDPGPFVVDFGGMPRLTATCVPRYSVK